MGNTGIDNLLLQQIEALYHTLEHQGLQFTFKWVASQVRINSNDCADFAARTVVDSAGVDVCNLTHGFEDPCYISYLVVASTGHPTGKAGDIKREYRQMAECRGRNRREQVFLTRRGISDIVVATTT